MASREKTFYSLKATIESQLASQNVKQRLAEELPAKLSQNFGLNLAEVLDKLFEDFVQRLADQRFKQSKMPVA